MADPTYIVETTINPGHPVEVSEAEYLRLLNLGLLLNETPTPQVGVFDTEVTVLFNNLASTFRAQLDARYVVGDGLRVADPLTQGAYDALPVKDPQTLYIIAP